MLWNISSISTVLNPGMMSSFVITPYSSMTHLVINISLSSETQYFIPCFTCLLLGSSLLSNCFLNLSLMVCRLLPYTVLRSLMFSECKKRRLNFLWLSKDSENFNILEYSTVSKCLQPEKGSIRNLCVLLSRYKICLMRTIHDVTSLQ